MRVVVVVCLAVLLAGCSGTSATDTPSPTEAPTETPTVAPAPPTATLAPSVAEATPDISLAVDAEFRQHLQTVVTQFSGDLSVWAQDSSDPASATSEGAFFLADAKTELAYLAAHPAAACYSGAWDMWRRVVVAVRDLFAAAAAGKPTASLLAAATQTATDFANAGINTSC